MSRPSSELKVRRNRQGLESQWPQDHEALSKQPQNINGKKVRVHSLDLLPLGEFGLPPDLVRKGGGQVFHLARSQISLETRWGLDVADQRPFLCP